MPSLTFNRQIFQKPGWAYGATDSMEKLNFGPVASADLVGPDGACAGVAPPAPEGDGKAANAQELPLPRGIGLGMTECDVVRAAGPTQQLDFGTNERGERTVSMTYTHGDRPGIYRFVGGRLSMIERAPEPVAERPKPKRKVAKPKPKARAPKAARAAPPAGPAPAQPAPAQQAAAPWPAPQRQAPAASPWPAPQAAAPKTDSSIWPAPPPPPQR